MYTCNVRSGGLFQYEFGLVLCTHVNVVTFADDVDPFEKALIDKTKQFAAILFSSLSPSSTISIQSLTRYANIANG